MKNLPKHKTLKNLVVFFLISLIAFTFSNPSYSQNSILKSSTGQNGGQVRIVFELHKFPKYRAYTLSNPDQLVIDIQDCKTPEKKMIFENPLFRASKVSRNSTNDLRIKINLAGKIKIKQTLILKPESDKKNYRLVVDVIKADDKTATNKAAAIEQPKTTPTNASKDNAKKSNNKTPDTTKTETIKTDSKKSQNSKQTAKDKTTTKDQIKPATTKDQPKNDKKTNPKTLNKNELQTNNNVIDETKLAAVTPLNNAITNKIIDPETGTVKYIVKKKIVDIDDASTTVSALPIIVIDAGHGGKDPGTIGKYARTKEKYVTLAYARELKRSLDETGKFRTYLTRGTDVFIPLDERVAKSRKLKADLFISIHADSADSSSTSGLSIYTLSEKSSDAQAEKLAQKENRSDIIGGADLSTTKDDDVLKTLINLAQRNSMNNSAIFAEMAIKYFDHNNVLVLQNTHRFAGFRVLTAPDIPAVLIELGYLSNKYEERLLNSLNHRERVAESLVRSIDNYFRNGRK